MSAGQHPEAWYVPLLSIIWTCGSIQCRYHGWQGSASVMFCFSRWHPRHTFQVCGWSFGIVYSENVSMHSNSWEEIKATRNWSALHCCPQAPLYLLLFSPFPKNFMKYKTAVERKLRVGQLMETFIPSKHVKGQHNGAKAKSLIKGSNCVHIPKEKRHKDIVQKPSVTDVNHFFLVDPKVMSLVQELLPVFFRRSNWIIIISSRIKNLSAF